MATEPIVEDLERLMEKCETVSEQFDDILGSLPVSEEEGVALKYIHSRHGSYEPLGPGLGYEVAYNSFDQLLDIIGNEDLHVRQERYRRALGIPGLEEEYRVQLRLVEDAPFRENMFDIYKTKVWPVMQRSLA